MALSWLMVVLLLLPHKLRSQSDATSFDFTSYNVLDPSLTFQGDVEISIDDIPAVTLTALNNGLPRRPRPYSVGRMLYTPPIRLWDGAGRRQANFQTEFHFRIANVWAELMGDGIAFFIAPGNTTIPRNSTGGYLGLYEASGTSPTPLFAVELDIFQNSWDPSYHHVGININSTNSVAVERLKSTLPEMHGGTVRITYIAGERLIAVVFTSEDPSGHITTLEHTFDLKTLLPEWVQVGISASTGQETAYLSISRWNLISFLVSDDDVTNTDDVRQYV